MGLVQPGKEAALEGSNSSPPVPAGWVLPLWIDLQALPQKPLLLVLRRSAVSHDGVSEKGIQFCIEEVESG